MSEHQILITTESQGESKRKWEKFLYLARTEHSYCVFVINIAIITIIITQLLLLVFCQLAVFRHTLIMNYYLFSCIDFEFWVSSSLSLSLFQSILVHTHIMTFVFFVHFVPSSLDVVVVQRRHHQNTRHLRFSLAYGNDKAIIISM